MLRRVPPATLPLHYRAAGPAPRYQPTAAGQAGGFVLMSLPMLGLLTRGIHGLRQGIGWLGRKLARVEERIAQEDPGVVEAREAALTQANRGREVHIARGFEDLVQFWEGPAHSEALKYLVLERESSGTRELHLIAEGQHLSGGEPGDKLVAAGMMVVEVHARCVNINGLSGGAPTLPHGVEPMTPMIPLAEEVGLMSARTFLLELLSTPEAPVRVRVSLGDDGIPLRFDDEHDCYVVGPLTGAADAESILNVLQHDRSGVLVTFDPLLAERSPEEQGWLAPLLSPALS